MRLMSALPWRPSKPRRKARKGKSRRATHGRKGVTRLRVNRHLAAGLVICAGIVGVAALWQSGWAGRQAALAGEALLGLTARAGLRVEDVLVEGRVRTQRSQITRILGVTRNSPILAFDPQAAKDLLEALPWVRSAAVERRLPRLIYVRLTERRPLAIWQNHGNLAVIDSRGEVLSDVRPEGFAELPLVVGEGAPPHAADLLAMLAREPELSTRVAAAVRVRGRRWNLRLDGGIDVRLPEADAAGAWSELARIQREHGVLGRDVVVIDLRTPDRLVVRTAPGAAPGTDGGKDSAQGGEDT